MNPSSRIVLGTCALLSLPHCRDDNAQQRDETECASAEECSADLLCAYNRCRPRCTADHQCDPTASCVPSASEPPEYVCTLSDEGSGQGCPGGLAEDSAGSCRRPCATNSPTAGDTCGAAQTCTNGWCRVPTATDGGVPDGTDGGPDGGGDTGPGDADATTGTDADVGGSGDGTVADTSNDPDGGTISDADSGPADGGSTDSGRDGAPTAPGEWTLVKAGTFHMGSPDTELGRSKNEPLHQVTLTRNFWIMTTEVTQEQFADTMGYGPSSFTSCGVTCPVETASWHEFAAYANALSLAAGLGQCYECTGTAPSFSCLLNSSYDSPYDCPGYRLPTEAEWEYAARAGTTTATYGGDLDVTQCDASAVLGPLAWFCANSRSRTHPAGQKMANPWRLADMLGNVAEWCHDGDGALPTTPVTDPVGPESSRFRVIRGGNWDEFAKVLRAASRSSISPNRGNSTTGGRLAMSVP